MRRSLAAFAVALVSVLACSSSSTSSSPAADDPNVFQHDVMLSMSLTVPAAAELHQCQLVQLPKGDDLNIVRFAHQYTPGSHHFLLYETDLTEIPPDLAGQYDCTIGDEPVMAHTRSILYAAQTPKGNFPFPPGVGTTFKGGSVVMFQSHYINPGKDPIAAKVEFGLDTAPADTIKEKAGFFLFYDPFIRLPPNGTAKSGIRCPVGNDIKVLMATSHYHQRGKTMKVYADLPGAPPSATPFYETNDWEHPQEFKGPQDIAAGTTIRFNCEYDNTSEPTEIFQGPNAKTSEMCVLAGIYYPVAPDPKWQTCNLPSIVGHGDQSCYDVATCIQKCPSSEAPHRTWSGVQVGPCWERCVASGCDGAVDTFLPLASCIGKNCAAECAAGPCTTCITEKCAPSLETCSSHTCTAPGN